MTPIAVIENSLTGLLDHHVSATPDKPFVKCGDGSWLSYAEVARRSNRIASGLREQGIKPGDHVAIILPNCEEFLLAVFALARLTAIQVPINTSLKGEFLRYQLSHSESVALITDSLGIGQVRDLIGGLPLLEKVLRITTDTSVDGSLATRSVTEFAELERIGDEAATFDPLDPRSVHAIMYTSGTTGLPKGCLISHRYSTSIGRKVAASEFTHPDDLLLSPLPLFHISGQFVLMSQALASGCPFVLEPAFSASRMFDRARELGATNLLGMGPMVAALLNQPSREDDRDHAVRVGMFVPVPVDKQVEFRARFGVEVLCEFYAQTEWSPIAICPVSGPRLPGSAGIPAPGVDIKIVDDDDVEVPMGKVGEIVARPDTPGMMFDGYWNDPEVTLRTWKNFWHHTGDYGRIDDTGHLHYVDRKKDAMRRRGELVSSQELEVAILACPLVSAVATIPVPSPLGEDDIKACVVAAEGVDLTPEALFDYFRSSLPYYAIPRYVEVMPVLPTNASQRVMKHKLRDDPFTDETWDFETMGLTVSREDRRR